MLILQTIGRRARFITTANTDKITNIQNKTQLNFMHRGLFLVLKGN